jgi:hypothetical protein
VGRRHLDAEVFTGKPIGKSPLYLRIGKPRQVFLHKCSEIRKVELSRIPVSEDGDGEAWQTRNVRSLPEESPDVHLHLVLRSGEGPIERGKATEKAVEGEVAADERLLHRLFSGNRQEARSDQNQTAGISAATQWC